VALAVVHDLREARAPADRQRPQASHFRRAAPIGNLDLVKNHRFRRRFWLKSSGPEDPSASMCSATSRAAETFWSGPLPRHVRAGPLLRLPARPARLSARLSGLCPRFLLRIIIEAMAAGFPIVASNTGSFFGLCDDGANPGRQTRHRLRRGAATIPEPCGRRLREGRTAVGKASHVAQCTYATAGCGR